MSWRDAVKTVHGSRYLDGLKENTLWLSGKSAGVEKCKDCPWGQECADRVGEQHLHTVGRDINQCSYYGK